MKYLLLGLLVISAIIFAFMAGFNFAIKGKAKDMLDKMNMGTIIFDLRPDNKEDLFTCHFEKNPREMLDKEFILMEVKIRE